MIRDRENEIRRNGGRERDREREESRHRNHHYEISTVYRDHYNPEMAVMYSELAQNDIDEDRADILSPSEPLSPALSSSPMPFLPSVKSSFTPLSMSIDGSDLSPGIDRGGKYTDYKGEETGFGYKKGIVSTATTAQNSHNNDPVTARATGAIEKNNHHEYEPSAPNNARPLSPSTNPKLENISSGLDSAIFRKREPWAKPESSKPLSGPRGDRGQARAPSPGIASPKDYPSSPRNREQQQRREDDARQSFIVKPKPIIRTASTKSVSLRHPTPDLNTRSISYASNIAQLEATAERLSLTSSIEDAIRDLHEEQKRNDSRRSSILAASIGSIPEVDEHIPFALQTSGASSIREANSAARQGGYSPAAFVLSASNSPHPNSARLRSGSNPLSRPDSESENLLSRHGPGKSSVRSVRSIKLTLTHIDEMEPTTLTPAAMDAADKLPKVPDEDETLRIPYAGDHDLTPNTRPYGNPDTMDYWDQAVADAQRESEYNTHGSPTRAESTGTNEQAERAFADFDGAHCSPDADFEDVPFRNPNAGAQPSHPGPRTSGDHPDHSRPALPRHLVGTTERPKSYLDPETGNTMLYYPARVPMMLNLPGKLSKKPKPGVKNVRRSQVISAMPEANRASWLPEYQPEPLDPFGSAPDPSTSQAQPEKRPEHGPELPVPDQSEAQPQPLAYGEKRKSRMSVFDTNNRKSQVPDLEGLPPQLRASAYFDLPPESVNVELKDGSAMATLDSILDASAKAPVSAFTDHVFAGSLGTEVYGVENRRKSHLKKASNASTNVLEPKKRSSFLQLRKHSSHHSDSKGGDRHDTDEKAGSSKNAVNEEEENQRRSGSIDGGSAQEKDGDEDEEFLFNGPPTTLLAELQMRKQQQKLRTRPTVQAYPHGLHSTLLELDTVAEIERKARLGKKVNLAWETPSANGAEESEDEDTPLGLLMARREHENDMSALADLHRPLGLMEQKAIEENEPLSRRRDRLQGRDNATMQRSNLPTLNPFFTMSRGATRAPSPRRQAQAPEDENENETLGERMRRLRGSEDGDNPLPRARPVSAAFSVELLNQLGDTFKDEEEEDAKGKGKQGGKPPEEEETLGQRRRRLQAEREARDHEMGPRSAPLQQQPLPGQRPPSMADVLAATHARSLLNDPRAERDRARQQEAAQYRSDQDLKLAAFRSQLPANLSTPNLTATSGFMAGGLGLGSGRPRTGVPTGAAGIGMINRGLVGTTYPTVGAAGIASPGHAVVAAPVPVQGGVQPPAQMDMVERWRQSVWP